MDGRGIAIIQWVGGQKVADEEAWRTGAPARPGPALLAYLETYCNWLNCLHQGPASSSNVGLSVVFLYLSTFLDLVKFWSRLFMLDTKLDRRILSRIVG